MLIVAAVLAAVLAAPSECAKNLQEKGAKDTKRAEQVCKCIGDQETATVQKKDACLAKVYGWDLQTATQLIGRCAQDLGGSPEAVDVCACIVWDMIEDRPVAEWNKATPDELQKFISKRGPACVERLGPTSGQSQSFPDPDKAIVETSCRL